MTGLEVKAAMALWRKRLEWKLAIAAIKLNAGIPDSQFDALTAEVEEFSAVVDAIADMRVVDFDHEEAA